MIAEGTDYQRPDAVNVPRQCASDIFALGSITDSDADPVG